MWLCLRSLHWLLWFKNQMTSSSSFPSQNSGGHCNGEIFCMWLFHHHAGGHLPTFGNGISRRQLWKHVGEWTGKAAKWWKHRAMKSRKAMEQIDRKDDPEVKLLRFQSTRITYFISPGCTAGVSRDQFRISAGGTLCNHPENKQKEAFD